MKFLDQAKIYIKAGNGGSGSASFRREKFVEYGGPDGGDGGDGGSIIVQSDRNLNTLIDFRYAQHFKAQHGKSGSKKKQDWCQWRRFDFKGSIRNTSIRGG